MKGSLVTNVVTVNLVFHVHQIFDQFVGSIVETVGQALSTFDLQLIQYVNYEHNTLQLA